MQQASMGHGHRAYGLLLDRSNDHRSACPPEHFGWSTSLRPGRPCRAGDRRDERRGQDSPAATRTTTSGCASGRGCRPPCRGGCGSRPRPSLPSLLAVTFVRRPSRRCASFLPSYQSSGVVAQLVLAAKDDKGDRTRR